jgi:hypothetical protein
VPKFSRYQTLNAAAVRLTGIMRVHLMGSHRHRIGLVHVGQGRWGVRSLSDQAARAHVLKHRGATCRSRLPRERFRCVLGMLSSSEVKVLRPT